MIVYFEGDTAAQQSEAKSIHEVLSFAYPGHPWAVRVTRGGFFIRHLAFPSSWGMACRASEVSHDAAVMKRTIIRLAGEWLERANMRRGRYDDLQDAGPVEGVPPGRKGRRER